MATTAGIILKFMADISGAERGFSRLKGKSGSVEAQLNKVNRALKFNPGNTELLAQKQTLLRQRVTQTQDALARLKARQKELDNQGLDKNSAEYMKVRRQIIETESRLKKFTADARALNSVKLSALSANFKSVGSSMMRVGAMASAASVPIIMAGKKALSLAQVQGQAETKLTEIYKKRMGATDGAAKSTMQLASAIQKQGVVGDEVTLSGAQQLATFAKYPKTINKLLPAMDNLLVQQKGANGTAQDATNIANLMGKAMMGNTGALKRVGISFTDAQAKVLKYGTEQEKASMLSKVITKNVGNMNKAFAKTDAGKIAQAKNALGDVGETMGAVLLPALASAAKWLSSKVIPKMQAFMDLCKKHPIVGKIAVAIAGILAVGGPLLTMLGGVASGIGSIFSLVSKVPKLSFNPWILAIMGAIIAITLLVTHWKQVKATLVKIWNKMKSAAITIFGAYVKIVTAPYRLAAKGAIKIWNGLKSATLSVWGKIKGGVITAVHGIKRGMSTTFGTLKGIASKSFNAVKNAITHPIKTAYGLLRSIVSKIKSLFSHMHLSFPHVKLPHFRVSGGKAPWGLGGKGHMPTVGIDWYAKGAIFTRPTLLGNKGVGDGGAEAVLPLSKLWDQMDRMSASIINGVAQVVAAGQGGGGDTTVILYAYPNGPKMDEFVVRSYERGRKTIGRKR